MKEVSVLTKMKIKDKLSLLAKDEEGNLFITRRAEIVYNLLINDLKRTSQSLNAYMDRVNNSPVPSAQGDLVSGSVKIMEFETTARRAAIMEALKVDHETIRLLMEGQ